MGKGLSQFPSRGRYHHAIEIEHPDSCQGRALCISQYRLQGLAGTSRVWIGRGTRHAIGWGG